MNKLIEVAELYNTCKAINDAKVDFEESKNANNR